MLVDFSKIQGVVKPESRKHTQKYPLNKKGMTMNRVGWGWPLLSHLVKKRLV